LANLAQADQQEEEPVLTLPVAAAPQELPRLAAAAAAAAAATDERVMRFPLQPRILNSGSSSAAAAATAAATEYVPVRSTDMARLMVAPDAAFSGSAGETVEVKETLKFKSFYKSRLIQYFNIYFIY